MNTVLTCFGLALLAGVACAQAAAPRDAALATTSTKALLPKLGCYLEATGQVARFIADIPRNCLDLAWRSRHRHPGPLYVFPPCLITSAAATYQLTTIVYKPCNAMSWH
ncbi:uncharacterized protein LOC117641004 [Thrips palmi]|uniref:Uncharacterized protein LOC117641004 n=1 Tax=Thrips palmi TaxID=161013 RepID=A0A6P8YJ67_THRPL|nr:uncharacterized protein LOC117641004 [Thrips palmi]